MHDLVQQHCVQILQRANHNNLKKEQRLTKKNL